jgi:4-alpha-glucanotransferase
MISVEQRGAGLVASPDAADLQAARQTDDVDYTAVTALKMTALRMAWKGFSARNDEAMAEFRQFVREGESLYWQAAFDALHAWQVKQDPLRWGWPAWPKAYQDTDSPAVKAFCTEHADEVNFYLWLQWLAYTSLPNAGIPARTMPCRSVCIATWRWALRKVGRKPGAIASCIV